MFQDNYTTLRNCTFSKKNLEKATKLVQISIGLPERASKNCCYWRNQFSMWTL